MADGKLTKFECSFWGPMTIICILLSILIFATSSKAEVVKNKTSVDLQKKSPVHGESSLLAHAKKQRGPGAPFWVPASVAVGSEDLSPAAYAQKMVSGVSQIFGKFASTIAGARQHLAAGAAARGVSIFAMYPLDTIKTRLQMEASKVIKPAEGASFLSKVVALYKGCPESLFGQIPYGMLTFGSYEVYKDLLSQGLPQLPKTFCYFIAAVLGDITGSFWLVPSEIVKLRMQSGGQASLAGCLSDIWQKGGPLGFYKGYTGQIARDVPFRAIQLTTYETIKTLYFRYRSRRRQERGEEALGEEEEQKLSGVEGAVLGACAGSFAAGLTTPLDVIKTRMMTEAGTTTVWKLSTEIFKSEGVAGLFRGLGPRVVYIGPSVAIFFMTYEVVKNFVADNNSRLAASQVKQPEPTHSKQKLVTLNSQGKKAL